MVFKSFFSFLYLYLWCDLENFLRTKIAQPTWRRTLKKKLCRWPYQTRRSISPVWLALKFHCIGGFPYTEYLFLSGFSMHPFENSAHGVQSILYFQFFVCIWLVLIVKWIWWLFKLYITAVPLVRIADLSLNEILIYTSFTGDFVRLHLKGLSYFCYHRLSASESTTKIGTIVTELCILFLFTQLLSILQWF